MIRFTPLQKDLPELKLTRSLTSEHVQNLHDKYEYFVMYCPGSIRVCVDKIPMIQKIGGTTQITNDSAWMYYVLRGCATDDDDISVIIDSLAIIAGIEKEESNEEEIEEIAPEPVQQQVSILQSVEMQSVVSEDDFLLQLRTLAGDLDELNDSRPFCVPDATTLQTNPGEDPEHWMNDRKCTIIMKIKGIVSGYAYIHRGTAYTCSHVVRRGKLVIPYWSDDSGSKLMHKQVSTTPWKATLTNGRIFSDNDGDVTIFPITARDTELAKPEVNEIHVYIDHDNRR